MGRSTTIHFVIRAPRKIIAEELSKAFRKAKGFAVKIKGKVVRWTVAKLEFVGTLLSI